MKVPKSIGYFHHFDLYQQEKFKILNHFKKCDIPQYIIKNCLIQEDRKYYQYNDFWTKYIPLEPKSTQDSKVIYHNVMEELKKFYENEGNL